MPISFAPLAEHPAVRALIAATAGAECHLVGGVLRDFALVSWLGLFTVIGAVMLLLNLRVRLKEST